MWISFINKDNPKYPSFYEVMQMTMKLWQYLVIVSKKNQSIENAGVEFVRGANERNELFEKINKQ